MKPTAFLLAGAVLGLSSIFVHADQIDDSKAAMGAISGATRSGARIASGSEAFDLAKVQAIFKTYVDSGKKMETLFPESSKTGNTTAGPKIWEDPAGFKAAQLKFENDAAAGARAATDLASFRSAFGVVTQNCGSCHEAYRVRK